MIFTKQKAIPAVTIVCAGLANGAVAGQLDVGLADYLDMVPDDRVVSTLVFLSDAVEPHALHTDLVTAGLDRHTRHGIVIDALQNIAADTQPLVLAAIEQLKSNDEVVDYEPFWITNAIRMDGTRAAIEAIAARRDVGIVFYNYEIEGADEITEIEGKPGDAIAGTGPEPGLVAVRAPEVWALGFDGTGVLVSTLDTGVDGSHPALASRWKGLDPEYIGNPEWAWFDPVTNTTFPFDSASHGTHTMGTVIGGAPGNEIGVAPGAKWIHAAVIDRVSLAQTVADAIIAFQWIADPDGDSGTSTDVPQTCSNSWGIATVHNTPPYNSPCDDSFWSFIDAAEAAGCIVLFSGGNEGSMPNTLRRPADRATTDYSNMAVASVDANVVGWPLSFFSSRGPTDCGPGGFSAIKPDISAPGQNVVSSVPGDSYASLSGTSMASPHVNGVMALMLQACPELTPEEAKQIIYDSAVDLGDPGKDNDFGYGMIDAYEAVLLALERCGPLPPLAQHAHYEVPVDADPVEIAIVAVDPDDSPGGPIQYVLTSGPVYGALADAGDGHVIGAGEYPYTLVNNGNIVNYTPNGGFFGDDGFTFAGDDGGSPPDAGQGDDALISILMLFPPPTISTESLPVGYLDVAYPPTQLEAEFGQPPLAWSITGPHQYSETDLDANEFLTGGVAQGWHADGDSWSYILPFTFEFFGDVYQELWVTSDGYLSFDGPGSSLLNNDSALIQATRIAPLWDDLRTDMGGDIYIDESVFGQVTIRWDSVTWSGHFPCNHACTLYADGRIRFHYGSGNTPVSATIGISSGDGVQYALSSYNNLPDLGNVNSHEFDAPPPLPDGMNLDAAGLLSGTPLGSGIFAPQFLVTDALGRTDLRQIVIEISDDGCPGDFDGSGDVGFGDLVELLSAWGDCDGACPADLTGSGDVGFSDLIILLSAWGTC